MAHSKLSLSSAKRWMNCPGSIKLIEQCPEQPASIYAAEGTAAHAVLESLLLNRGIPLRNAENLLPHDIGFLHNVEGFEFTTTGEMLEAVQVGFDYVMEQVSYYKLRTHQIETESKVRIPGHNDLWGTSDIRLYVPYNRLIVIDYKHGKGVKVDVDSNEQLMAYAVGAYFELPEDERTEIPTIEIVIIQPRVIGGEPISRFEFPVETLLEFHKNIVEAAHETEKPDAKVKAGDWCRFCPAKLFCGEYRNNALSQANIDFANVPSIVTEVQMTTTKSGRPKTVEVEKLSPALPDFHEMALDRLSALLRAKKSIIEYFNDAEEYAEQLANKGTKIPGYKLVDATGNRTWKNEVQVEEALVDLLGSGWAYKKKVLSPNQFEEALKKVHPESIPESLLCHYEMILNNIYKPSKGVVLVQENDKRPEARTQAIADFAEVASAQ